MIISLSGQCTSDRYKLFQSYSDEKVMSNGFSDEPRKKVMNCSLNESRNQWSGSETVLQSPKYSSNTVLPRQNGLKMERVAFSWGGRINPQLKRTNSLQASDSYSRAEFWFQFRKGPGCSKICKPHCILQPPVNASHMSADKLPCWDSGGKSLKKKKAVEDKGSTKPNYFLHLQKISWIIWKAPSPPDSTGWPTMSTSFFF